MIQEQEQETTNAAPMPADIFRPPVEPLSVWPKKEENDNDDEAETPGMDEYLVDVETHTALLVRATTPETAAAKAVLHTLEPETDGSVTEVARDVHTCVHSGIDDEECDHEEHDG